GLQAIGTARRLGAVVTGYDVREAARADIASTGASVLDLGTEATGEGGYARELTAEEAAGQQDVMAAAVARFDVVITTAQVPGRTPPVLVTAEALAAMRPGSVVVDLAASDLGGNVVGSPPRCPARPPRRTRATSSRCCPTWSRTGGSCSTRPTRSPPASSSPTTGRSCTRPYASF